MREYIPQIRRDILRMVHQCQSGHPGGSLGCTEYIAHLYFNEMDHNPKNFSMNGDGEDLFFLSNGHISPVLYSVLARSGYFPVEELGTFRHIDSRLQGHPTPHEGLPGIRIASGSLGQGMSVAIGAAQAKKLNGCKHFVYVLMGDGEQQEGQVWEAAMYAPHNEIDNLIAAIDVNGQQIDGPVKKVLDVGDLEAKYKAFGWATVQLKDGNDLEQIAAALKEAKSKAGKGKPVMILMKTEMGNGVDFMMNSHKWHGVAPNDEQLETALSQNPSELQDY